VLEMAKTTQAEARRLAGTVNHPQMPAYYDRILGQYTLAPRRRPRASNRLSNAASAC
jgi:hypothetical protein